MLSREEDADSTCVEGVPFIFYHSVCYEAVVDIPEIEVTDVLDKIASVRLWEIWVVKSINDPPFQIVGARTYGLCPSSSCCSSHHESFASHSKDMPNTGSWTLLVLSTTGFRDRISHSNDSPHQRLALVVWFFQWHCIAQLACYSALSEIERLGVRSHTPR